MSIDRPSMKEDDHPDHNMPAPEHDGVQLAGTFSSFMNALPPTDSRLSQDPGSKKSQAEKWDSITVKKPSLAPKPTDK